MLQTGEIAQFDELGRLGVVLLELGERLVDGQKLIALIRRLDDRFFESNPHRTAAVFDGRAFASTFDENATHGFRGGAKEMATVLKVELAASFGIGRQQTQ